MLREPDTHIVRAGIAYTLIIISFCTLKTCLSFTQDCFKMLSLAYFPLS